MLGGFSQNETESFEAPAAEGLGRTSPGPCGDAETWPGGGP